MEYTHFPLHAIVDLKSFGGRKEDRKSYFSIKIKSKTSFWELGNHQFLGVNLRIFRTIIKNFFDVQFLK